MVVARDAKAETMGTMAELPPDLSPFQIGTKGEWEGKGFEIVGRVRVEWQEGSWNEWCILYDAATTGWLAEAQGLLMVSFETEPDVPLSAHESEYQAGADLKLLGKRWTVSDSKMTTCRAGEGELPFVAPPNSMRASVDLLNNHGGFANIEFAEQGPVLYVGKYGRFEDFHFQNLRPVRGWSAETPEEKNAATALSCPNCGAPVSLRAAGQTMAAVCPSCGSVIDTATPELSIIEKAEAARREIPTLIPIGSRGKLFGMELEMIGVMTRRDEGASWMEYLLFNPWTGFRWLVFYAGHWTFVEQMPALPDAAGDTVSAQGRTYRLYAKETARVTGVLGEFYWKVRRGEETACADYIAPPFILSKESYPELHEFTWSTGEYVEPAVIAEAFALKDLPKPDGIYLNQPNKFKQRWKGVRGISLAAFGLLVLLEIIFTLSQKTSAVWSGSFTFDRKTPVAPIVTPPFDIDRAGAVTVDASGAVDNSWLDLDLELVDAATNQSTPETLELSYYYGYDDGSWHEGGHSGSVGFPNVAPGQYRLTIEPSAAPEVTSVPYTIRISRGGVYQSNFILCLVLILLYPLYLGLRSSRFEQTRWADSDLSDA